MSGAPRFTVSALHSAWTEATQAASGLGRVFEKTVQCSFHIIRKMLRATLQPCPNDHKWLCDSYLHLNPRNAYRKWGAVLLGFLPCSTSLPRGWDPGVCAPQTSPPPRWDLGSLYPIAVPTAWVAPRGPHPLATPTI